MFVYNPVTKSYVKVPKPGRPVILKSSAKIGSHWPRNHGVRYMAK